MTRKEQARLLRMEIENRELRKALEHHQDVNRNMLYEVVEMKTKLALVDWALHGDESVC